MGKIAVGIALRDRLGEDGARALSEFVEHHSEARRTEVVNTCMETFEGRLHHYATNVLATKTELADVRVDLSSKLSDLRVELLRWSFLFWIGQVAAMFAAMAMLAEWIRS